MAATPESKVKKKVVAKLKSRKIYHFYPVTGGFGRSGVPDVVACYRGVFIGIECKAGKNKPTDLQRKNLDDISGCGGIALVINEENLDMVDATLDAIEWRLEEWRNTDPQ